MMLQTVSNNPDFLFFKSNAGLYIKLPYAMRLVHPVFSQNRHPSTACRTKKAFSFFLISQDISRFVSLVSLTFACSLLFPSWLLLLLKQQCEWKGHSCLTFNVNISGVFLNKMSVSYSILLAPLCHYKAENLLNTDTENSGETIFVSLSFPLQFFLSPWKRDRIGRYTGWQGRGNQETLGYYLLIIF